MLVVEGVMVVVKWVEVLVVLCFVIVKCGDYVWLLLKCYDGVFVCFSLLDGDVMELVLNLL